MFPPKPSESVQEWVTGLWESLCRASSAWSDEARVDNEEDRVRIALFLRQSIATKDQLFVRRYIKEYAREAGWKVSELKIQPSYVAFFVSRA